MGSRNCKNIVPASTKELVQTSSEVELQVLLRTKRKLSDTREQEFVVHLINILTVRQSTLSNQYGKTSVITRVQLLCKTSTFPSANIPLNPKVNTFIFSLRMMLQVCNRSAVSCGFCQSIVLVVEAPSVYASFYHTVLNFQTHIFTFSFTVYFLLFGSLLKSDSCTRASPVLPDRKDYCVCYKVTAQEHQAFAMCSFPRASFTTDRQQTLGLQGCFTSSNQLSPRKDQECKLRPNTIKSAKHLLYYTSSAYECPFRLTLESKLIL